MNPLYLQGKAGMNVRLEGPALSVATIEKTRQLFPLTRISRVIVSGCVDWQMPALFACADAGIGIVFLNEYGEVRCRWLGRSKAQQNIVQQFVTLLQRVDALLRYKNWCLAMERMAVRSASRRLNFSDWQVTESRVFELWVKQSLPGDWMIVLNFLEGFIVSHVLDYLGSLGLDSSCEYLMGESINLVEDLAQLLLWDFYPVLLTWNSRSEVIPENEEVARFYQGRSQRVEHLLHGLLNRLHQCLLEGV